MLLSCFWGERRERGLLLFCVVVLMHSSDVQHEGFFDSSIMPLRRPRIRIGSHDAIDGR
jgi:hypothetical protein